MTTTPEERPAHAPSSPITSADDAVLDAARDVVDELAASERLPEATPAMEALDTGRRLLFVHAHPDDETINNGATMASYSAQGASVTLVTCTRGELGEVIPTQLRHLEGDGDALAEHRTGELAAAMEALGVSDHRFLGAASGQRFRDSGMAYDADGRAVAPPDMGPDAFARVPVDEAAHSLVEVIRQVRPQVVVTYEPGGGYGHPDHVHTHRVTMRAVELAAQHDAGAGEPWQVPRVYWTVSPEGQTRQALRVLADSGITTFDPDGVLPSMVVPEDQVDAVVDASEHLDAKAAALRAHATQVVVEGQTFGLSNGIHQPLTGVEHYQLASGGVAGNGKPVTDLFEGIGLA